MKKIELNIFRKKHFAVRSVIVIMATIIMGFALSWLLLVDFGTDPCTAMNHAISGKLGISLGNWQALLNCIMLVFVLLFGGKNLGIGTIANMFLVGYSVDFFSWIWSRVLPAGLFENMNVRILVLFPALAVFVVAAALYMAIDMGTAPYDAIPFIVSEHCKKVPFRLIRMAYDFFIIAIACIFGSSVQIVTILMAISLGPLVAWVSKFGRKLAPTLFEDSI